MANAEELGAAPILSTPDTHILEGIKPPFHAQNPETLSEEQLSVIYEIDRTIREIRTGKWRRVALQFPDEMLPDAPRVFQALSRGLRETPASVPAKSNGSSGDNLTEHVNELMLDENDENETRLYILGDTSYGACCVDEIAAEHVDADVVVHYGRSCLSPTARLAVVHVFTQRPLAHEAVMRAFKETYPIQNTKIILMADLLYTNHIDSISQGLREDGYANLFTTSVIHDPSSSIPNRTIPIEAEKGASTLAEWHLFHISDPPTSLLLTLSSRLASIHIYPTDPTPTSNPKPLQASTAMALRRRYALLTSLNTVSVFGILINTLSVKNYLHMVEHVKAQIAAAGKKSYMFVVGKLNAAKVANFSEIGGWVVIGCWESSLVESKDFWRPVITPFELDLLLKGDAERVWTGEWKSDFQDILDLAEMDKSNGMLHCRGNETTQISDACGSDDASSEPESAPPEFDLRTGRYVSHTRPMETTRTVSPRNRSSLSTAVTKRAMGDVTVVGNAMSPGAEYLRSKRTWKGLGSDFEIRYEDDINGAPMEQGRSGKAWGYVVGDSGEKH